MTRLIRAIISSSGKENFVKQLESIVESVKQSRSKIERHQLEEKNRRDGLTIQLTQLVDKARQYAKVLKDFQDVNSAICFSLIHASSFLFRPYVKMNLSWPNPSESLFPLCLFFFLFLIKKILALTPILD